MPAEFNMFKDLLVADLSKEEKYISHSAVGPSVASIKEY